MKKPLLLHRLLLTFSLFFLMIPNPAPAQVDDDVTEKTQFLYENLKKIQNSNKFMFGQEFFNSFRYNSGSAHGDLEYSDSKAVTGSHPAVLGSDFHYYLDKNAQERGFHTEAVKWAYEKGHVITFDWHLSGRGTATYEYTETSKDLANNIVADLNGDRAWYFQQLDAVIDIINNDLVVDGEQIPIVFRPLHEMGGGWFWWGSKAITPGNFQLLFALTVDYVQARTNSVLFCWSPNTPASFDYYPGDEYVDVLGIDSYDVADTEMWGLTIPAFRIELAKIIDYAQANDKVAAFTETGSRTNDGAKASRYWAETILPAILDDPSGKSQKIAWVLTWINSSWSYPYVPHPTSTALAKESFLEFEESPHSLFGEDLPDLYAHIDEISDVPVDPGPLAVKDADGFENEILIYPSPASDHFTIRLKDFEKGARISILELNGKVVQEVISGEEETLVQISASLTSGLYILRVADTRKSATTKLIVQ